MAERTITGGGIAGLAPTLFTLREPAPAADDDVRAQFARLYKPLRDGGLEPYHLARVASALYYYRPLLSAAVGRARAKHVLEIGSGYGWKALAWADLFATYT